MPQDILIIDDEWAIALALGARLKDHGFSVRTARDGHAGLAAAKQCPPDAILLDLRMPDIDGFEVQRRLNADINLANIPVIFLSANVLDSAKQQAQGAGAAGFFAKPYQSDEIVAALTVAITAAARPAANAA